MGILERRSDSYLTWAKSRDTEVYRAARDAGALRNSGGRPESFEMDQATQIAAGMYGLLQELLKASPRVKKFTTKPWPTPETAAALVKREDADQGYDDLMDDIVFVDQDEFERHIAQHADEESILRIEREANGEN